MLKVHMYSIANLFELENIVPYLCISEDVMSLVLSERKSINTLTYLILIIMAYFGPNAKLLGNIQLRIWQYQRPIMDIEAYIFKVSLLMAVDLGSFVINGIPSLSVCHVKLGFP